MAMTATKAIKTFFEQNGGRQVTIQEFKALTFEDKQELGKLACEQLEQEFEPSTAETKTKN